MSDNFSEDLVDVGVALVDLFIENEDVIVYYFARYSGDFLIADEMHFKLVLDSVRRLCPIPMLTDEFELVVMLKFKAKLDNMLDDI